MSPETLQYIVLSFPVFLFSLVFHEYAHALAGEALGDRTARQFGRLTLNPIPHIDPIGTIAFPLLGMLTGGIMFGWARPVPFTPSRLRNPLRDAAIIAAAGPAANAFLAVAFALALRPLVAAAGGSGSPILTGAARMAEVGVVWNVVLCWFNLLPIPPLDGSKVAAFFLPGRMREQMWMAQSLGALPLFALFLLPGVAATLMAPASFVIQAIRNWALS